MIGYFRVKLPDHGTDFLCLYPDKQYDPCGVQNHKNRVYQLAILHEQPDDKNIFCPKYIDGHLYVTVPSNHAFASRKTLFLPALKE